MSDDASKEKVEAVGGTRGAEVGQPGFATLEGALQATRGPTKAAPPKHAGGALSPGTIWTLLISAPGGVRHGEKLAHGAGGVLAILAFRADKAGYCYQRVPGLAHRARLGMRTTWRALGGRTPARSETGLGGAGALTATRRPTGVVDVQIRLQGRERRDGLAAKTANRLLDRAEQAQLPHGAGCVLAVLLALADGRGKVSGVDVQTISMFSGISERQTKRCIAALWTANLATTKRTWNTSTYRLILPGKVAVASRPSQAELMAANRAKIRSFVDE